MQDAWAMQMSSALAMISTFPTEREARDTPSEAESSRALSAPSTEPSGPSRSVAAALWCSAKVRRRPAVSAAGRRHTMTDSDTLRR